MRISLMFCAALAVNMVCVSNDASSLSRVSFGDILTGYDEELPLLLEENFPLALLEQHRLFTAIDTKILGYLNEGLEWRTIADGLQELEGHIRGSRESRFRMDRVRTVSGDIFLAVYQIDIGGPSAFRIIDSDNGKYRVVFSSDRQLSVYQLTYFALDVTAMPPSREVVPILSVSGGTDSGVHRTAILWEYSLQEKKLVARVRFKEKPGLIHKWDKKSSELEISYCKPSGVDELPSDCTFRIRYVYDVSEGISLKSREEEPRE